MFKFVDWILRWAAPYKYVLGDKNEQMQKVNKKKLTEKENIGVELISIEEVLTLERAKERLLQGRDYATCYYHDRNYHQVAVKFPSNAAKKYNGRNDAQRKRLEPLIYPKSFGKKVPYDRTHIIPFGYHGSESDKRLLIGFSWKLNRGEMNKFESKISKINEKKPILWFVNIQKNRKKGITWQTVVWDEEGDLIAERTWKDNREFEWGEG